MIIRNNLSANKAMNSLKTSKEKLQKKTTNLSSGKKLNVAADDAAGLAMSNKMKVMIRGLQQANNNIADGKNLINTADGGMADITSIMQRQRELVVAAMNETHDEVDQKAIKEELNALSAEIDRIANATEFNGIKLLCVPKVGSLGGSFTGDYYRHLNTIDPVASDGRFQFSAEKLSGQSSILTFGDGGTSVPSFQLTDIATGTTSGQIRLRDCTLTGATVTDSSLPSWTTEYNYSAGAFDVTVNQIVTIKKDARDNEYYSITYDIKNNGANQISADFLCNIDVMFSTIAGDNPRFVQNGVINTHISDGTVFRDGGIPGKLDIYDPEDKSLNARIIPDGDGSNPPDKLFVGNYNAIQSLDFNSNAPIVDSGCSVVWTDRTINPGDSLSLNTWYGVTDPSENPEFGEKNQTIWIQSGAYGLDGQWIDLYDCRPGSLNVRDLPIDPREKAKESLDKLDSAINTVSVYRGRSGAQYNSLEAADSVASVMHFNTQSAESLVTSADMAKEVCDLTKFQVITQASQAMLAQANQVPQNILQLLG